MLSPGGDRGPKHARPGITVVVPVYDSATILPELVSQLVPVLEGMSDAYEVLLVNDYNAPEFTGQ